MPKRPKERIFDHGNNRTFQNDPRPPPLPLNKNSQGSMEDDGDNDSDNENDGVEDCTSSSSSSSVGQSLQSENNNGSTSLISSTTTAAAAAAATSSQYFLNNLQDLAEAFRTGVSIRNRLYGLRIYKQCFVGKEAVDCLVYLTKQSRDEVLETATILQQNEHYCPFEHVCDGINHPSLEDDYLFYRFQPRRRTRKLELETHDSNNKHNDENKVTNRSFDNMVNQSREEAQNMTIFEKIRFFERGVQIQDRKYHLRTYPKCFVGRHAIDFMVASGLAPTREAAVQLGNTFMREHNVMEHVTREHEFEDRYLFYRFVKRKNRFLAMDDQYTSSVMVIDGTNLEDDVTESSIGDPYEYYNLNSSPFYTSFQPQSTMWSSDTAPNLLPSSLRVSSDGGSSSTDNREPIRSLKEVADAMERGITCKTHRWRLKYYKNCFVATEAVSFLVSEGFANDRKTAVQLGKRLQRELNLYHHVCEEHDFQDTYYFFRFTPLEERYAEPVTVELPLPEIAKVFQQGVQVRTHTYHLRNYPETFVGKEAVDFLVQSRLADSRMGAVRIGRALVEHYNLFERVTGDIEFCDDQFLFRFVPPSKQKDPALPANNNNITPILDGSIVFYNYADNETNGTLDQPFQRRYSSGRERKPFETESTSDTSSTAGPLLPLESIADAVQRGVKIKDRRHRFRTYKKCFIGSECVDFLVGADFADSRKSAVEIGKKLVRDQYVEHVCQDHDFEDEYLFYRFLKEKNEDRSTFLFEDVAIGWLINMGMQFEEGMETKENRVGLRVYQSTFYGSEAVDYILDRFSFMVKTRRSAVHFGRQLNREFNLFEHVTNAYHFKDCDKSLYYFTRNKDRYRGLFFQRMPANKDLFEAVSETNTIWDSICDIAVDVPDISEFEIVSEDSEWANSLRDFEVRCSHRKVFERSFMKAENEELEESVMEKVRRWSSSFRQLDPRYQILSFFNDVAHARADEVECEGTTAIMKKRPLLWYLPSRASVFTVWRPCSKDSIRRMMLGEAVGKGLDIKGKSAKRGKLSAYVPFLQINNNAHKKAIRMLSKDSTVRVYYGRDGRRARDVAAEKLETVAMEMLETVREAKKILSNDKSSEAVRQEAYDCMLLDMADPAIRFLDDYAPERFGLEIPERLFWEAYFARQDCSRPRGSEYETGRGSLPAFQDMNFAALRKRPHDEGSPRVVIYQNADPNSPMNPFELLMAYEQHGRVLPVVSDFDCFLVGTRRVDFTEPLPREQIEVLRWMLAGIEKIHESGGTEDMSWMAQWIQVLRSAAKEGFHPEVPAYGFGDPRSYAIISKSVESLNQSGAVRHAAESFNYLFPQDLDEEFLIIGDDLTGSVPWKYVDVKDLHAFLSEKVNQGFTFPLNPKWILVDGPNWKVLYDKMLNSHHQNIVDSMNAWFPPASGIREEIERIHRKIKMVTIQNNIAM